MALARTTKKQQKENRDEKDTKIITVKTLKTRCIISIKKEKNNDAILNNNATKCLQQLHQHQ